MICKRFALVGSGFIGQVHAASLARHEGSSLTMVADAAPERAQALAARYGARAVTVSEAIHSDAIDAVLIASSTPSHAELLEAAARAGKAVYCEKPIDLSLARAREVVERVLPLNVPVTVGFNRRFDSSHQQLRRQLEQGLIGRVELVQMVCRASSMPPLDYLRSSGGQMRDQAIHFFDLLRFLTGDEVRTVAAMGAALALPDIAEFGDVDTSILMMQMRGGALAQLDNTRRTGHGYDERITLLGAEGALESGSQSPAGPTLWRGNQRIEPGLWPDWFSRVQGSYYQHLDAFIRSLNGETVADLPGLLDGLQAQAIAEETQSRLDEFVEEQTGDEGYLKEYLNDKDKVDAKSVAARLKILKKADPKGEEYAALKQLTDLTDSLSKQNKAVKEMNAELEEKVRAKYALLTDEEILDLLVNRKWYATIFEGIKALYVTTSHQMTNRIVELVERYEDTLPELSAAVAEYEAKVKDHLKRMGFVW